MYSLCFCSIINYLAKPREKPTAKYTNIQHRDTNIYLKNFVQKKIMGKNRENIIMNEKITR